MISTAIIHSGYRVAVTLIIGRLLLDFIEDKNVALLNDSSDSRVCLNEVSTLNLTFVPLTLIANSQFFPINLVVITFQLLQFPIQLHMLHLPIIGTLDLLTCLLHYVLIAVQ